MIITLTGITQALKHLGPINSYFIRNNSTGFDVVLSQTSVKKDGETATNITGSIAVKSGFTITEAIKIMMGGADKTSAWLVSGQINIPVSEITGDISITGIAISESGSGDSGSGGNAGGDSGTTNSTVDITNQFEFQNNYMISSATSEGKFQSYNGSWVANENYVDISNYSEIKIKMSKTSAAGTNTGIAFYDASKKCVTGYAHTLGDNQYGVMERTFKRVASPATGQTIVQEVIEIPETAVYVRTTYWNTAEGTANYNTSFGEFYCIATPKTTA